MIKVSPELVKNRAQELTIYKDYLSYNVVKVGEIRIEPSHDGIAYVSWVVFPQWQGQGIAYEAMKPLLIDVLVYYHRAVAIIAPDNEASKALARKLGFRYEGTAKEGRTLDGGDTYHDIEFWACLWADMIDARKE